MQSDGDISAGTRLRASVSGRVYTVTKTEDGTVHFSRLPPVSLAELEDDIDAGRTEVVCS